MATPSAAAAPEDADDPTIDDAGAAPESMGEVPAALRAAPGADPAAARAAAPQAHAAVARAAQIDALVPRTGASTGAGTADAGWIAGASALPGGNSGASDARAASSAIGLDIGTAVGEPGFGQELARGLVYLAHSGTQSAELALNPEHLGPVRVALQMDGQQATLVFSASHESTRQALQEALPQLHALFEQNGLHLGGAQVGDGSQPGAGGDAAARGDARGARTAGKDADAAAAAQIAASAPRRVGLVDTFA